MIIVLDASAAVEVVLNRPMAEKLSGTLMQADYVIVPSLFVAEVTNVFWKYSQHGDMAVTDCEKYLDAVLKIPDQIIEIDDMAKETMNTAVLTGMTAYDMFYLVLARRNNAALMTLDKKLTAVAEAQAINIC